MKGKQFLRKLRKAGVEIIEKRGKGSHVYARYRGRRSTILMHGNRDLGPNYLKDVCKQLGLDPKEVL